MRYEWKKGARSARKFKCQPVAEQIRAILHEKGDLDPDILKVFRHIIP